MTEGAGARPACAGIDCPTRVIHADPAQPYLPDDLRRARAALLPHGELRVLAGGHHLHMEDPQAVAEAIGDFFSVGAGRFGAQSRFVSCSADLHRIAVRR